MIDNNKPQMTLRKIRSYMQLHRQATLGDLALHFDVNVNAMRGMIDIWLKKGRVKELEFKADCNKSCHLSCADSAMTIYEWVETDDKLKVSKNQFKELPVFNSHSSSCRHQTR